MLSKPSWILFLLMIKTFKNDENLLMNVTFPYKTLILVRFNVWLTARTRNLWRRHCKALITERHRENAVQGLVKEATDSWVFDSRGNAIIMIICRDLRKAFDTEGRTILLSKLSLIFRIESEYTLLVVHSPKPVPSNVVSPKGIYSVLYRSLSRSDHFVPRD